MEEQIGFDHSMITVFKKYNLSKQIRLQINNVRIECVKKFFLCVSEKYQDPHDII